MRRDARLCIAGPDVVFEDFGGEVVVLNLTSGRYFGFNATAAAIWDALVHGASLEEIARAVPDADAAEALAAQFVDNLLLVESDDAPAELGSELRARLGAGTEPAVLEVYDDLADLIVADPIHDTDVEFGWPVRAPAER